MSLINPAPTPSARKSRTSGALPLGDTATYCECARESRPLPGSSTGLLPYLTPRAASLCHCDTQPQPRAAVIRSSRTEGLVTLMMADGVRELADMCPVIAMESIRRYLTHARRAASTLRGGCPRAVSQLRSIRHCKRTQSRQAPPISPLEQEYNRPVEYR